MLIVFSAIIDTIKTKKSNDSGNTSIVSFEQLDSLTVNSEDASASIMAKLLELFAKDKAVYVAVSTNEPDLMYKHDENNSPVLLSGVTMRVDNSRKQEVQNAVSKGKHTWSRTSPA